MNLQHRPGRSRLPAFRDGCTTAGTRPRCRPLFLFVLFAAGFLALPVAPVGGTSPAVAHDPCNLPEPIVYVSLKHALAQARELTSLGKDEEALARLQGFERNNPRQRHYRLYFLMGVIATRQKDNERAATWLEKSVEMWPCDGQTLQDLAVIRYEEGRTEEAARLMEKACGLIRPADPELLYKASCLWIKAGKGDKAVPLLEALCARHHPRTEWLLLLLQAYIEDKDLEKAAPLLRKVLHRMPEREDLWQTDAWIALEQKNYIRAAASLKIAHLIKPPGASGREQLAQIYAAAGIPGMAAEQYRLAFGADPDAGQLDTLAGIYLQAHEDAAALAEARKALRKEPTAERWSLVGNIYLAQEAYAEALAAFSRAAAMNDPDGRTSLTAGYVAMKMEDWSQAIKFLRRAIAESGKGSKVRTEASRSLSSIQAYVRETR